MKFQLVRHGETEANVAGLYNGHIPAPLTGQDITQAQTLGTLLHRMPVDNVLCSELERTHHTTQLTLGDRKVPVHNMPELNEMFLGDWEIRHRRDLAREDAENYTVWYNDRQDTTPTNGEGFQAFSQRAKHFIARLADYKMSQNLLVVSHRDVLSVLITRLLSMPAAIM